MFGGGLARFGFVTELLSMPVRMGYLMGIAVTVIVAQLPKLFGFSVNSESFIRGVHDFVAGLDETNTTALATAWASLALILGLRRVAPQVPGVFLAVVGATAVVAVGGLDDDVPVVGAVPAGLPDFGLPHVSFADFNTLIPAAVGIAFVAFADTSVLSRSYAGAAAPGGRPEPGARRPRPGERRGWLLPGLPRLEEQLAHGRRRGRRRPQPVRGADPRRRPRPCC